MKKKALIMVLCICMVLLCTGCKSKVQSLELSELEDETVLLRSDGTVQSGSFEEFDAYYYKEDEVEMFMENAITQFNEQQGEDCVELSKFSFDDSSGKKIAKAIFTYDNFEAYSALNGIDAACYTMKEAKEAGVLPAKFTIAADGSRTDQKEVTQNSDYKVLVIQYKADIILPDAVKYYSNAMLLSSNTVETTGEEVAVIVYK